MRLPDPRTRKTPPIATDGPQGRALTQADKDLLIKGILCALIGVLVLVAPHFMSNPATRDTLFQAAVVGWFALVLGCAFVGLHLRRRMQARK